jgi:hypothetical protein
LWIAATIGQRRVAAHAYFAALEREETAAHAYQMACVACRDASAGARLRLPRNVSGAGSN